MDIFVIGFALFAMFFGAGNLIFPPSLGHAYGSLWLLSGLAFSFMAVGLTILSLISVARKRGDMFVFTSMAGKRLSKVIILVVLSCIGPLNAMPRTSATTMEIFEAIGFKINPLIFSLIFFGFVIFFALRENSVVDMIGKFMTPILLISLAILFFAGIVKPIGPISQMNIKATEVVGSSMIEGYNTMDSLATLAFTIVIVKSLTAKGYKEDLIKKTIQASLIAVVFLSIVYIGLAYLGATTSSLVDREFSRVDLLIFIADSLIGDIGKLVLGLAMMMACFTTATGLATSISEIFSDFTNKKVSYRAAVIFACMLSAILSVFGVENIVKLAVPLLVFIYPLIILLVIFNLFDDKIDPTIVKASFVVVTIICLIHAIKDMINTIGQVFNLDMGIWQKLADSLGSLVGQLPFDDLGFPWILPFIITLIVSFIYTRVRKSKA
ncbi:MAG: branched-chain amino acid transport system II carrier protein [Anaerococcus sp.]|nr:branched-chain amino acid transport system II carrier protein [Peptoniphilaceae bacterium]MDY3055431.1 branched-chain amino acid transport system II carrier protein [Anaerococcus sp.]